MIYGDRCRIFEAKAAEAHPLQHTAFNVSPEVDCTQINKPAPSIRKYGTGVIAHHPYAIKS